MQMNYFKKMYSVLINAHFILNENQPKTFSNFSAFGVYQFENIIKLFFALSWLKILYIDTVSFLFWYQYQDFWCIR